MSISKNLINVVNKWINNDVKHCFHRSDIYKLLHDLKHEHGKYEYKLRKNANLIKWQKDIVENLFEQDLIWEQFNFFYLRNRPAHVMKVLCDMYPYGYISYLSAMQFYDLTNRLPKNIDFVVPPAAHWISNQKEVAEAYLQSERNLGYRQFTIPFPSNDIYVDGTKINIWQRNQEKQLEHSQSDDGIRLITVGSLFLDMLRHPELCGGFEHVLDIYLEYGLAFEDKIIDAVNEFGTHIDKSRVGFLLEKQCHSKNQAIANWKKSSVSRGSSRKLIAKADYAPIYDEDWCISLNHRTFW